MQTSGHKGAKLSFCCGVSPSHRPFCMHDPSGDKMAPSGIVNPDDESNTLPKLVRAFQADSCNASAMFRGPLSDVVGLTTREPSGERSNCQPGFPVDSRRRYSSLIVSPGRIADIVRSRLVASWSTPLERTVRSAFVTPTLRHPFRSRTNVMPSRALRRPLKNSARRCPPLRTAPP